MMVKLYAPCMFLARFASNRSLFSFPHSGVYCRRGFATQAQPSSIVDKESLRELRQRTGYSFVNCKKALQQFGADLDAAERWLHQLAQKEGWEKAGKLQGRQAANGLVGVVTHGRCGALVEVNCETDFVARSELFRQLVAVAAQTSLESVKNRRLENSNGVLQLALDISNLTQGADQSCGEALGGRLSVAVAKLGEKITLKRAYALLASADRGIDVVGYVHPRSEDACVDGVTLGQYGTLLALSSVDGMPGTNLAKVGQQICQHVVGMSPRHIGNMPTIKELQVLQDARQRIESARLEAEKQAALREQTEDTTAQSDESQPATKAGDVSGVSPAEDRLLWQSFMLYPDMIVAEFLQAQNVRVLDFIRCQCGENM